MNINDVVFLRVSVNAKHIGSFTVIQSSQVSEMAVKNSDELFSVRIYLELSD